MSNHPPLTAEQVNALYKTYKETGHLTVADIRHLEMSLKTEFANTKDFETKLEKFLAYDNLGTKLRAVREKLGWTQEYLGAFLGVSKQMIAQMESGAKPLTDKALRFLEEKGHI